MERKPKIKIAAAPSTRRATRRARMPHLVRPMLATLVDGPFDRTHWIFEVKWDGFRAIAEVEAGKVRLYSRNHKSFESRFAPVAAALARLKHDLVLDGEIVALDEQGRSHFQTLQNYQRTGEGTLIYYVFDLLYADGEDLRSEPLHVRKTRLKKLLPNQDPLRVSEHIEESGVAYYDAAVEHGLEGIIAKDANSQYVEGARTPSWLKIKSRRQQEAVIGGFTEPRRSRQGLGSLVLGVYKGKDLIYIGHAGGGFNDNGLLAMRARLNPLVRATCPFKTKPKTNAPVHWVNPKLVCEVEFQEWTEDGTMRQPIFLGLREDKAARSVKRELPESLEEAMSKSKGTAEKRK
jgi:bifunctional non-homologous end joining protein LigD